MQKLKKKATAYYVLILPFTLYLALFLIKAYIPKTKVSRWVASEPELTNSQMMATGTLLMIPPWIRQYFLQQQQQILNGFPPNIGNTSILDFLIHNFSARGPSAEEDNKYTFYVPLVRSNYLSEYDDEGDGYLSRTEYFDVNDISIRDRDSDNLTFTTKKRIDMEKNLEITSHHITPKIKPIALQAPPTPSSSSEKDIKKDTETSATLENTETESNTKTSKDLENTETETNTKTSADLENTETETNTETSVALENTETETNTETSAGIETPLDIEASSELTDKTEEEPKDYAEDSCDTMDQKSQTEAIALCSSCHTKKKEIIKGLSKINETVKTQKTKKAGYSNVIQNFCNSCKPVPFKNFMSYVQQRAETEKIPSEIFFALMLQESNGMCHAKNESPRESSFGLLQLNTKSPGSTCLKKCNVALFDSSVQDLKTACEGGSYRQKSSCSQHHENGVCLNCRKNNKPFTCLNNPYCNFEESLNLMKRKWRIGNKRTPLSAQNNWLEMSKELRNQWRNAIIAYNGAKYMKKAEHSMNDDDQDTNNWELKRIHFIKANWLSTHNETAKKNMIHNIAYMERITGREIPCGGANSIILEWLRLLENKSSLNCPGS